MTTQNPNPQALSTEPLQLFATGETTTNPDIIKYTLTQESIDALREAGINNIPLIGSILNCNFTPAEGGFKNHTYVCIHSEKSIDPTGSGVFNLIFFRQENQSLYKLKCSAIIRKNNLITPAKMVLTTEHKLGDYISNRYYLQTPGTYDMNDFQKSGGLSLGSSDTVIINNLPTGVSLATGYVLSCYTGVTQMITDLITDKTYTRRYGLKMTPAPTLGWSEWQELGKNNPDVYLVSEYPSDLTDYAEGSIFIKQ